MKKRMIAMGIAVVLLAAGVFSGGRIDRYISQVRADEMQRQLSSINLEEIRTELTINDIASRIENFEPQSLPDKLRSKGYYADEINSAMKKYITTNVLYQISVPEHEYLLTLVDAGYNFERLVDIYSFIRITNQNIACIRDIYDIAAPDFEGDLWIENAYDLYIGTVDVFSIEDMYYYTERGISVDEIMHCYTMSLTGIKTIREILNARVDGCTWYSIASEIYELPEVEAGCEPTLADISVAVSIARANGKQVFEVADGGKKFCIKESAWQEQASRQQNIKQLYQQFSLVDADDASIIQAAAARLPALDNEQIKMLLQQGYRIRDIEEAVSTRQEKTPQAIEVQEALEVMNVREEF